MRTTCIGVAVRGAGERLEVAVERDAREVGRRRPRRDPRSRARAPRRGPPASISTVSAAPGKVPASTSARYARIARRGSCRGGPRTCGRASASSRPRPSVSVITWIWPEQPAPAPIPIVGIRSRSVIAAASWPGTSSSTTAKAPASWTASASASSWRACSRLLPWTRTRPIVLIACGVSPMWPMTGMPGADERLDRPGAPDAALELDGLGAGLAQEPAGVGDGVLGRRVGQERHVARRPAPASCRGPRPSCGGASRPSTRGRSCRSRASPAPASRRPGSAGSRPRRRARPSG